MLKEQQGKNIVEWGGATFVSSLMNKALLDEVRLMIQSHYFGWRKSAVQRCERATFLETSECQAIKIRHGNLDVQHMILNVMIDPSSQVYLLL